MRNSKIEQKDLVTRLNALVNHKIIEVSEAGSALILRIAQSSDESLVRTILLLPDWRVEFSNVWQLDNSHFGRYEHHFETKLEWQSYKNQVEKNKHQLIELKGLEVLEFKLNKQDLSLKLRLQNEASITSTLDKTGYETVNFIFKDPATDSTYSHSRKEVDVINSAIGQVVASREFTFRKSGNDFIATVYIGTPRVSVSDEESNDSYYCAFEIECELGSASGGSYGEDSLQALQLALRSAQFEIDKLAAKLEAEAFRFDEGFDPIYKFREEFKTLHALMDRLHTESHFDKSFSASPEGLECLKLMNETLKSLKSFREDQKP